MKIGILGAGTWGTALAALLAKNGHGVSLWSALPEEAEQLKSTGRHRNLPEVILPHGIEYTLDIAEAICGAGLVIFVTPSEFIRPTAARAAAHIEPHQIVASAAKGIEKETLMTMTEIISEEIDGCGVSPKALVALSGPTHAEEVALGLPTSIVAASENEEAALTVASLFSNSCLRAYVNSDVRGVELCGALKNIIVIAAGICHGIEFGDNAKAMLMTRGMTEIARLGIAMGCEKSTFYGLSGIGDLIVTCTSRHSRNNRCGELIGKGLTYEEAQREIGMVVEGYHALEAAVELSQKYNVEMPITQAVYDVIKRGRSPYSVIRELMTRGIKDESVI